MENNDQEFFGAERGGIVTARGTGDGLVIRLDGRVDQENLKGALKDFMQSRKAFLAGNEVVFEWVGRPPEESFVSSLSASITQDFGVVVTSSRFRDKQRVEAEGDAVASTGVNATGINSSVVGAAAMGKGGVARDSSRDSGIDSGQPKAYSLFDGIEAIHISEKGSVNDRSFRGAVSAGSVSVADERGKLAANSFLWDDPDARIVYATLRSGQKIETDHSLIVFGDVNSGAELIAGGDIVVLGTLRGIAHAGAYDESGGGRVIFALNLQATQLRIGVVISRGSSSESQKGAEVARIEGNMIVVEPYLARNFAGRKSN